MKILVIGGNRFFGKKLVGHLVDAGHRVSLLNRGNLEDGFGDRVSRLKCDRTDTLALASAVGDQTWDLVYDQVCFDHRTAKSACQVFDGKVGKYIYTSTQSVYGLGKDLVESDFIAEKYKFDQEATKESDYGEAKRQAELGFAESASFPVTMVRLPIVIGHDDYTKRFVFHVDRIQQGKEIFIPSSDAKISFVTSDFAASVLNDLGQIDFQGPVNAASPLPITLSRFVDIIEDVTAKKANLVNRETKENHSPYGIGGDWFMNCSRLHSLGIKGSEIEDWLPKLLA